MNSTLSFLRSAVSRTLCVATALASTTGHLFGQVCAITEGSRIDGPAPAIANNRFGVSVAIDGEWAIVGAPGNDQLATDAGAAYFLHRQNDQWTVAQTLLAPPGTPTPASDAFGYSVAIAGSVALVGAPAQVSAPSITGGVVHLYILNKGVWQHAAQLTASDISTSDQFGVSVAFDGNTVIIGATNNDDMGSNSGSAYIFTLDGMAWTEVQKLNASDGQNGDAFGSSVAVAGSTIVIGSPNDDDGGSDAGAAYVFALDNGTWTEAAKLHANDGVAFDGFGNSVATNGTSVVAGAPDHSSPHSSCGAAYAYTFNGRDWTLSQKIHSTDIASNDTFGASVAMSNDLLVVGAPGRQFSYSFAVPSASFAGAGYLFSLDGGMWNQRWQMHTKYIETNYNAPPTQYDFLGAAASIDEQTVLLGAPMLQSFDSGPGYVLTFPVLPPDCDANGVPDVCETDCNHNLLADVCELLANETDDCNNNGVPDECDNGFDYVIDTGFGAFGVGSSACPVDPIDFIWLNQFHVVPGGQHINRVAFAWLSWAGQTPGDILIYDDPDNNGDLSDAVLLSSTPAVSTDAFGLTNPVLFTTYEVPLTYVGEISESFFVGMRMSIQCGMAPAIADLSPHTPELSWRISAPIGTANVAQPATNPTVVLMNPEWMIRAAGLDCDANGTWDQCDIDGNPSLDLNANGILDTCDLPCPGDVAGGTATTGFRDGTVNIDDLLEVIAHWAKTGDPGTISGDIFPPGGDGTVNIDDLLEIIGTWGVCP